MKDIEIYNYNIGGNSKEQEEIYNRNLENGNFSISDLSVNTRNKTTTITEAKIIINHIEYIAEITTDGNNQLLTFLEDTPVTIFNVNNMKDLEIRTQSYAFIITTSELHTYTVHRNITYIFNEFGNIGDITGDGLYNILDVVSLNDRIVAGSCTDVDGGVPCDLNGDGEYDLLDIIVLANYVISRNYID